MSKARLTRQEVGWLLAQEARGAAKALRQGVTQLSDSDVQITEATPLESTLNALDEAITLWAELDPGPSTRGRRGRIDVAALLYEVAPSARISIETGEGTEVFGDESDLRRLVHVLVSRRAHAIAADATVGDVDVRRDGDWIRVSVDLGPDLSASEDLERRWLSRMATRFGGRIELVGSTETLILPADDASEHVEVAHLRKELQEAQELGETYARELARVFTDMQLRPPSISSRPPQPAQMDLLTSMAAILVRSFKPLFVRVREASQQAENAAAGIEVARGLSEIAAAGLDVLSDLDHTADIPDDEVPERVDLQGIVRAAVDANEARASQRGVSVELRAAPLAVTARAASLGLMIRALVAHAIFATPRGGRVAVGVQREKDRLVVSVEDGGPPVPASAGPDLLSQHVDPMTFGRPGGVSLLIARVAAESQGGELIIDESPDAATRLIARIPVRDPAPAPAPDRG